MSVISVRRFGALLAALAVLALVSLLSLWIGSKSIPFGSTLSVLLHHDGSPEAAIIHDLRVPRTLLGILVGAALGLAGAVLQAMTGNPLADPGLFGINAGAAAAVVSGIAFAGVASVSGYVWFAFAGAALAAMLVYGAGSAGGGVTPDRILLAGAAVTAVLIAYVSALLMLNTETFNQFRFWSVGSLSGRRMDVVTALAPFIAAGIVLALCLARPFNVLALGDQHGRALGVRVGRTKALGVVAVTVLCGAATAAAGPIAFVGLAVPRAARLLVGPDQRWVFPLSALLAPILLLLADIVGRVVIAPEELQVAIVTAFLGAPVFIALVRR
ncbi:iron complex transport system permease protein [Amycolatopsis xylanica]|uniref:Iron complex transport system permease protein n=1 Tax=Amycolatopsis xylanica TaxID=589385 RepID=A0A1H3P7H3_9PSEU|nr:iron chelate uptake ABC transporter family permease subunit [Amycolatopsis xylanica]SDY96765.1 iron complex transport system permease protein [Amycolatopsis xylanica]